jgi:hypothetical protein
MPGTSGIEVLETMRRRGDLQPIIDISGRTDALTRSGLTLPGGSPTIRSVPSSSIGRAPASPRSTKFSSARNRSPTSHGPSDLPKKIVIASERHGTRRAYYPELRNQ